MPIPSISHRHTTGVSRREMLQVGYSGLLGVGLHGLLAQRAAAATAAPTGAGSARTPKSMILVFLTGAASHHDTFDLKPDAPPEIRGEFNPISTPIPGFHICEHLPQLAARADKYAVVRTMSHRDNNHLMSTHHVLTGQIQPGAFFDKIASRDDRPCYASALDYLRPRHDGIPSGINLPTFLMQGPLTWPGQHAGLLGAKYDPWQINGDPNSDKFRVDALRLPAGIDVGRLENRQKLLQQINGQQNQIADALEYGRWTNQQQLAFSVLTSSKLAQAFELERETDATRNRYGRHSFGQSLLLARRLAQTGVPVVQVNMGQAQNWDNHGNIFPTLKNRLLPPLDQGVAALLDDLSATGMLDETLVLMVGEFGRTPKISSVNNNAAAGRDHWGPCFSALFAGAGVRGGQVIGKSDDIGAYPVTVPYSPDDLGATVFHLLGISPESEVRDRTGRPSQLNRGVVMDPLFTGSVG